MRGRTRGAPTLNRLSCKTRLIAASSLEGESLVWNTTPNDPLPTILHCVYCSSRVSPVMPSWTFSRMTSTNRVRQPPAPHQVARGLGAQLHSPPIRRLLNAAGRFEAILTARLPIQCYRPVWSMGRKGARVEEEEARGFVRAVLGNKGRGAESRDGATLVGSRSGLGEAAMRCKPARSGCAACIFLSFCLLVQLVQSWRCRTRVVDWVGMAGTGTRNADGSNGGARIKVGSVVSRADAAVCDSATGKLGAD